MAGAYLLCDFVVGGTRADLAARFLLETGAARSLAGAVWVHQVHGTRIARWQPHAPFDTDQEADGVTVDARSLDDSLQAPTAIVVTADCVPILWAHRREPLWGAVHASRQNLEDGILDSLTREITDLQATWADIDVVLGPAICGSCYEVGSELGDKWQQIDPQTLRLSTHGRPALDLPDYVSRMLASQGACVSTWASCTFENPHWFSYRRDQTVKRNLGWVRKTQ